MYTFRNYLRALVKDERGVTALEYGLIAGVMATAIVSALGVLATGLGDKFTAIVATLAGT